MCEPYKTSDEKTLIFKLNKAELIAIESGLQLLAIEWKNDKAMKESLEDAYYTLTDLIRQEALGRSK